MKRLQAVDQWPRWQRYGLVAAIALLAVIAIDLVTNDLNTTRYYWDFAIYFEMAEHGLDPGANDSLWAPFVYRFATPLLAGALNDLFDFETVTDGFKIIAYVGAVAQLVAVFALAEHFGLRFWMAVIPVAVIALTLYNVKFLIFDESRPDHLAYPLMIAALLAIWRRKYGLATALSCVGLLVREFLIIPPIILLLVLALEFWRERSWRVVGQMAAVLAAVSLFVIVQRVLIPIKGSGQFFDPVNNSDALTVLVNAPLSKRRLVNILLNFSGYMLPVLVLITPRRARAAWERLAGYRWLLGVYTALVLALTLYGGTDIWRFTTYQFVPLVIVLAVLLRGEIDRAEIVYMLAVTLVFNKILLDIPNWIDQYLDFYGGYDIRVNLTTFHRFYEIGTYVLGAILLRGLLGLARRGWLLSRRREDSAAHGIPTD